MCVSYPILRKQVMSSGSPYHQDIILSSSAGGRLRSSATQELHDCWVGTTRKNLRLIVRRKTSANEWTEQQGDVYEKTDVCDIACNAVYKIVVENRRQATASCRLLI